MFQFALPAVLFRFTYEAPQSAPLLQLPPTRATARERETHGLGRAQYPVVLNYPKFAAFGGLLPRSPWALTRQKAVHKKAKPR